MKPRGIWIILIIIFFLAGAAGSYFLLKYYTPAAPQPAANGTELQSPEIQDLITVRLMLPKDKKLVMTEKRLKSRIKNIALAEAVVEEFFKGAADAYAIPQNVKLLGIYRDANQMLYVDLSDELRRNFQGDALDEYLLLKGMYETLVSTIPDFQDLKVLVEGKEIETLGGHFFLKYPLKSLVMAEPKSESSTPHE
ncbi:MAG TPA: GerMN domain-containing protein [Thermodesulfovibrionales bacterium]|nr:GerMN domain-containing protein [Thermodesulfovibrionales bacterium]